MGIINPYPAGTGGGGSNPGAVGWTTVDLTGYTEVDPSALKGGSLSLGETSTFGIAAGVHGMGDTGRDAYAAHSETAIATYAVNTVLAYEFWLKWTSVSGGTGGGYFDFTVGLLTDKTLATGKIQANRALLGGARYTISAGHVDKVVAGRWGSAPNASAAITSGADGGILIRLPLDGGTRLGTAWAAGWSASDLEAADDLNTINVADADPLYPMIALGASTTGSSTEALMSGAQLWFRELTIANSKPA